MPKAGEQVAPVGELQHEHSTRSKDPGDLPEDSLRVADVEDQADRHDHVD
jgi:hypothetical protein